MSLPERWAAFLDGLRREGRHRELTPPRGIDFASNDYLGYGGGPPAGERVVLPRSGLASRLLARGHLPLYLRSWNQDPATVIKRAFIPNLAKTPGLAQAPLPDFLQQVNGILGQNTRLYIFLDRSLRRCHRVRHRVALG